VGPACVALTCPRGAPTNSGGPAAGAIMTTSNGGALSTKPDAGGAYDVARVARPLWSPKASLAFAAAGGAIPAFADRFCGPAPVAITKPASAPGAGLTIDRSSDLALQWTGGAGGDLELVLRDEDAGASSTVEVRCFFAASAGQATVPKAALARIGAGPHAIASYLWMRKIALPAGTCVELTAVTTNESAQGGPFNGPATYQ
jgi:hypothetical protein